MQDHEEYLERQRAHQEAMEQQAVLQEVEQNWQHSPDQAYQVDQAHDQGGEQPVAPTEPGLEVASEQQNIADVFEPSDESEDNNEDNNKDANWFRLYLVKHGRCVY